MEHLAALHDGDWLDFCQNDEPKCPHCGVVISIAENELWNLYEEGEHEIECTSCDLNFTVSTNVTYSFNTDEQEDDDAREVGRD